MLMWLLMEEYYNKFKTRLHLVSIDASGFFLVGFSDGM